jgi:NADP-dependent 3-hydroxy acid dehydrogenase YdfG
LITGALTGIGRATALAFGRQQFQLIVSGRREDAGHSLISELEALAAEAQFVQADVRKKADVKKLVDVALQRFGRIDVVVNNAGVEGALGSVGEQTVENYYSTFDTNVLGVLLSMKYEMPVMIAQGGGSIINRSSMVGKVGMAGASVYVASKHAVEGLTNQLHWKQHRQMYESMQPRPVKLKPQCWTALLAAVLKPRLVSLAWFQASVVGEWRKLPALSFFLLQIRRVI